MKIKDKWIFVIINDWIFIFICKVLGGFLKWMVFIDVCFSFWLLLLKWKFKKNFWNLFVDFWKVLGDLIFVCEGVFRFVIDIYCVCGFYFDIVLELIIKL